MARPSKYETHVAERFTEIADWLRNGANEREIAQRLGISADSLIEYKKKFSEFSELLKKTRACVDAEVENALLEKCRKGDTTAIIFWLKNRRPKQWSEKPNAEDIDKNEVRVIIERKVVDLSKEKKYDADSI